MTPRIAHLLRHGVAATACAVLGLAAAPAQAADAFPSQPIRLIVPYAPGGSLDAIARPLANELGARLGQSIIVENIAGASGTIGAARVVKARPDGHTLLLGITSNVALSPLVDSKVPYKTTDLAPVAKVGTSGLVLVARPDLPVSSMSDLIALAKRSPGKLSYGVPGSGSLYHLAMEDLNSTAGIDITLVPYSGAGQVGNDVMGSHLDLGLVGLPAFIPLIDSKKLKALAVMSKTRDIGAPDIPSASETGSLAQLDFSIWTGVFAPKDTPESIKATLHDAIVVVLADPDVKAQYARIGVAVAGPLSPSAYAEEIRQESVKLDAIARQNNIRINQD